MLTTDMLTAVEREELRRALARYADELRAVGRSRAPTVAKGEAKWRLHVAENMLRELGTS